MQDSPNSPDNSPAAPFPGEPAPPGVPFGATDPGSGADASAGAKTDANSLPDPGAGTASQSAESQAGFEPEKPEQITPPVDSPLPQAPITSPIPATPPSSTTAPTPPVPEVAERAEASGPIAPLQPAAASVGGAPPAPAPPTPSTPAPPEPTAPAGVNPALPTKRHRGKVRRIVIAVLPLVVIGGLVYVAFNFPALKNQAQFAFNKPKPGNSKLLPSTIRTGAAPASAAGAGSGGSNSASGIPIGGAACGRPVSYDGNGNPKAICDNYVYIPKIGVASPIRWPGQTSEAVINDELLKGVVHYPGTAEPGQKGNVFLTGHSSYYWWVQSDYRTVFTLVPQLVPGDEIIVYHKGIRYSYRVTDYQDVKPTNTDSLKPTTEPVITLSTCVPIGTSYERRIVRAKQVSPDPSTASSASSGNDSTPGRLPGVR